MITKSGSEKALGVALFTVRSATIKDICKIRKDNPNLDRAMFFDRFIPYYCFTTDKKALTLSEDYLQFSWIQEFNEGEKTDDLILFDLDSADNMLQEEINQIGVEDVFKKSSKELYNLLHACAVPLTQICIPPSAIVVVEMHYTTYGQGYENSYPDVDLFVFPKCLLGKDKQTIRELTQ